MEKKDESKDSPWVDYKPEEIENLIVDLSNQGVAPSRIGIVLRDQYGIPSVKTATQKRITDILKEKELSGEIPEDLLNLIRKSVMLRKHMLQNKKDFSAKRGYQLTVSKIRRLVHFYVKVGKLPQDWRYTPETAALLVK
jgi:ribosomal protein S15P/S13E